MKSYKGYGYMLLKVSPAMITGTMFAVDKDTQAKSVADTFTLDLTLGTIA